MKYISRTTALAASALIAAPAFADAGHHDANIVQTIIHWVTQPTHGLPLIALSVAAVIAVKFARRQRG